MPETLPALAVIVAVPVPTALAVPDALTVATAVLDDDQATVAATALPAEFFAVALNPCDAPTTMLAEEGETDTVDAAVVSPPVVPVMPPIRPTLASPQPWSAMTNTRDVARAGTRRHPTEAICI